MKAKQGAVGVVQVLAGMVLAVCAGAAAAAGINMQEGKWETTVQMRMEGLPGSMPPMTFTDSRCLTQKDLVPRSDRDAKTCQVKDQTIKDNTVSWHVQCADGPSTFEGKGQVTYSGDSYQGEMAATMTGQGRSAQSKYHFSGKRLGKCD